MDEETMKRRGMFAIVGFNLAVMLLIFIFYMTYGTVGRLGWFAAVGLGCVGAAVGFVAAMMTES